MSDRYTSIEVAWTLLSSAATSRSALLAYQAHCDRVALRTSGKNGLLKMAAVQAYRLELTRTAAHACLLLTGIGALLSIPSPSSRAVLSALLIGGVALLWLQTELAAYYRRRILDYEEERDGTYTD